MPPRWMRCSRASARAATLRDSARGQVDLVIEEILPEAVAGEEAFDDPPGVTLFPDEEAVVVRAVDKRRREFTTSRLCARRAFARLGVPPAPLVPGPRGAPRWPPGLVGSITHCVGYRAAAVARAGEVSAIGIDAEPNDALPDGVLAVVARPDERTPLRAMADANPGLCVDRLLFSAKESVFKAWFPLTGRELDFEEATVTFDPEASTFCARLLVYAPEAPGSGGRDLTSYSGRWVTRGGVIVTAVAVLPPGSGP
jgi:enterobactin synthetase component D / holo-[acyl-carrier protein] synthase